jgi:hypothetical protein
MLKYIYRISVVYISHMTINPDRVSRNMMLQWFLDKATEINLFQNVAVEYKAFASFRFVLVLSLDRIATEGNYSLHT